MISCTLNDKVYTINFVSGRALREIEPATTMYAKISKIASTKGDIKDEDKVSIPEALDVMVTWFCKLFNNQFTPDEVYDNYPSDRLMHDVALAIMAVQAQTTEILSTFPTMAVKETANQEKNGNL